ncbi:AraC-like DNA-binding protein [Chitinophaga skermanii]|uniref:AraC-like DNA-binding protein n=1 Tax=Chitinophaga skermanii TaxID=331697 RepID=A0A327QBB4_9BACT|nr:helix-turn-helix domain-containing protein [Chitinophaga skermanii]RAJ00493.1 AraC-like DNA-binding protein [Chitinophaga skermanii]
MHRHSSLPTISISDICRPLKDGQFSIFQQEVEGKPQLLQPHKHNFYLLLVVEKGSGVHTIDFEQYKVKHKQVYFLAPGQAHTWDLHPKTTGYQVLYTPGFSSFSPQQWPFFSFSAQPYLQLKGEAFDDILIELQHIQQEYNRADGFSTRIIMHRLWVLLSMLEREYEAQHPSQNLPPVRLVVNKFLQLLELHYKEHNQLTYYATSLFITPQYLNTICKKETGITAGDHIRQRLLLEAKRMLTLTQQDVKEIAFALGFSDTSYFSRFFKRYTGFTPVVFREEFQKVPSSHS